MSIAGMDKLLVDLSNLKKQNASGDGKLREFLVRLHEEGYQTAKLYFDGAAEPGVSVDPDPEWIEDGTGFYLKAQGERVIFVEFGSGVTYDPGGNPKGAELGFIPTSWSLSNAGKGNLMNKDWWIHTGEKGQYDEPKHKGKGWVSRGNPPANAMYEASKAMQMSVGRIAREVFGND